jgi:succinylglutamate desuccinylase
MVLYLHVKLYRNVFITGGTHGNERIGVLLAQQWQKNPEAVTRSTFKTEVRSRYSAQYSDSMRQPCG